MAFRILLFLLFISATSLGQMYSLKYVDTKTDASFRGLAVADEKAIWVSGSKGWVGRTTDGGENWSFQQVAGYENCDFRTLYAFDSSNAIIANAGSPAYILRTIDGGNTWKQVYKNNDSAAFIDGIDMSERNGKRCGLIHGDPIKGQMLLLYTHDKGNTWKECKNSPELSKGEASFAASGTAIKCFHNRTVVIATGGKKAQLYLSRNKGKQWRSILTPMLSGTESTGIYSFMLGTTVGHWFIAGGDYKQDSVRTANFFYTHDKGKTWQVPAITTRGYRECLASIYRKRPGKEPWVSTMFAVGPTGIDISADDGVTWKPLSDDKGFHVIKSSVNGTRMFLAGANGILAIMKTTQ